MSYSTVFETTTELNDNEPWIKILSTTIYSNARLGYTEKNL